MLPRAADAASCASPSISPDPGVRLLRVRGWTGSSPCRGRCIARRTRRWKIAGLKRGSHAFTITSAWWARASDATASASLASTVAASEAGVAERRDGPFGTSGIEVGEHEAVEEGAAARDRRDRGADPAGTDDEDAHPRTLGTPSRARLVIARSECGQAANARRAAPCAGCAAILRARYDENHPA